MSAWFCGLVGPQAVGQLTANLIEQRSNGFLARVGGRPRPMWEQAELAGETVRPGDHPDAQHVWRSRAASDATTLARIVGAIAAKGPVLVAPNVDADGEGRRLAAGNGRRNRHRLRSAEGLSGVALDPEPARQADEAETGIHLELHPRGSEMCVSRYRATWYARISGSASSSSCAKRG